MPYLETQHIVKRFADHLALNDVSIQVPENSIHGLLGPNGAGKTTLIRIINQITTPDSGIVLLNGNALKSEDVASIGYLPEERGLYKKMKVGDQIVFFGQLKGLTKEDAKTKMKRWLQRFDITDWQNKKIEELSKGMQQKVQFICTVIHEPKLLIFDEPFSGFDPVNAELLKKEILDLHKNGATLIFSTHNMNSVEELCNEITLIDHSKVVLQGEVTSIRQQFKKNLYRIIIDEKVIEPQPDLFEIEQINQNKGLNETILRLKEKNSNQKLIQYLSNNYHIRTFEEILPSMQEVFIETVRQ